MVQNLQKRKVVNQVRLSPNYHQFGDRFFEFFNGLRVPSEHILRKNQVARQIQTCKKHSVPNIHPLRLYRIVKNGLNGGKDLISSETRPPVSDNKSHGTRFIRLVTNRHLRGIFISQRNDMWVWVEQCLVRYIMQFMEIVPVDLLVWFYCWVCCPVQFLWLLCL